MRGETRRHRRLEDLHDAGDDDQRSLPLRWLVTARSDDAAVASISWRCSTSNTQTVRKFDTADMFGFWDWVGGRYSMDCAMSLSP